MARLIDADKLKVYLQKYLHYEHAIPWVDAQPTAYDVEKVVAELEEESFPTHENYSAIWFDKAIDIVRKGGVE